MHAPAHHLYLELLSGKLRLIILEGVRDSICLIISWVVLLVLLVDAGSLDLILEGMIILEFLRSMIPCKYDKHYPEE